MSPGSAPKALLHPDWQHGAVACRTCGQVALLNARVCAACSGTALETVELVGEGVVEASTIVAGRFSSDGDPFHVSLVRLTQGPLVLARTDNSLEIESRVIVEFQVGEPGIAVPTARVASD